MPHHKVVRTEDVNDLSLLPRRFDAFAAEVRTSFEVLGDKLLPAIERIHLAIEDMARRLSDIEKRVLALETKPRRKPRKK